GGDVLGVPVEAGDVLYLALEDGPRRMKDRLQKQLSDGEIPDRLQIVFDCPRLGSGCVERLEEGLAAHQKGRLVIIHTFKKRRPTRGGGHNAYDVDYDDVGALKKLADKYEVAIVPVHHTRKAAAEDVFDTVSGSRGLTGAADTTLILKRPAGSDVGTLFVQ